MRMEMYFQLLLLLLFLIAVFYLLSGRKGPLDDIPGPKPLPLLGNLLQLDASKPFISFAEIAKQYGGIFKIDLFKRTVIVNDPQLIHEVLTKHSADFGARPKSFRLALYSLDYHVLGMADIGPDVKMKRKAIHKYLKQFDFGMERIEEVVQSATDSFITRLYDKSATAIDISHDIFHCTTDILMVLLAGRPADENTVGLLKANVYELSSLLSPSVSGIILDLFPFTRYLGNKIYKDIKTSCGIFKTICRELLDEKPHDGFVHFMQSMSPEEQQAYFLHQDIDKVGTIYQIFVAGVITTSISLTCLMNIMCHYADVQEKVRKEILQVIGESSFPSLKDQASMPYLRATILELGRYASIVPFSLPHKAMISTEIGNYQIPKGTEVWPNLWCMHHDEKLWDEPFEFQPERFLDANGELVLADHPNRKNTMPFGAGQRGCVGEVLAMSRMFLISARLLQKFRILPESSLEQQPSCDPRNMTTGVTNLPPQFNVKLQVV